MRITILGSGTSTGVPLLGCSCSVCLSADPRDRRRRSGALVEHGGSRVLVDTNPDLRAQLLDAGVSGIDGVLYTHTHADHSHGIDDLRPFTEAGTIPVWADEATAVALENRFDYAFLRAPWMDHPRLRLSRVTAQTGGFRVGAVRVSRVPMNHGREEISGWLMRPAESSRGGVAWLCDASGLPRAGIDAVLEAEPELIVLDALRYKPHPTHLTIADAIELANRLGAPLTVFTHFSHDVSHRRIAAELPAGIIPAFDGMQLAVGSGAK